MWVKVITVIVRIVGEDKNLRTILLSIVAAILAPILLILFFVTSIGSAESNFNRQMASVVIGEADMDVSGYPRVAATFYSNNEKEIKEMQKLWDKEAPLFYFKEDFGTAMRVFMKATYFCYLLTNNDEITEESREDFIRPFLEEDKAEDVFRRLGENGIYFTADDESNIFALWSYVMFDRVIERNEDPYEIWTDEERTHNERFGSPFEVDWRSKVTSEFGMRIHPIYKTEKMHNGIDIGFPSGTNILSVSDGEVISSSMAGTAGNQIVIRSPEGYTFYYMHMSKRIAQTGDTVKVGDIIGLVGSTGNSTGPHLHLGVKDPDGNWINPREVISY